jgi:hypothetical protein
MQFILKYHRIIQTTAIVLSISTLAVWLVNKPKLRNCYEIEFPFTLWVGSYVLLLGVVGVTPWHHSTGFKPGRQHGETLIECFVGGFCSVITVATLVSVIATSVVLLDNRRCTASMIAEMPFIYVELYLAAILLVVLPVLYLVCYILAWVGVVVKLWLSEPTIDSPQTLPTVSPPVPTMIYPPVVDSPQTLPTVSPPVPTVIDPPAVDFVSL